MIFIIAAGENPIIGERAPQIPKKVLVDLVFPKDFDLLYAVTA